jgi:hypothetical protein
MSEIIDKNYSSNDELFEDAKDMIENENNNIDNCIDNCIDNNIDNCIEQNAVSIFKAKEKRMKNELYEKNINFCIFLETKVSVFFNKIFIKFSSGNIKKKENDNSVNFQMISFNHLPASIITHTFFRNSIRSTINREKSEEHITNLLNLDYINSIFDISPFIFAIMTNKLKNEISKTCILKDCNCLFHPNDELNEYEYYVYTLDGQHRLSTIYKGLEGKPNYNILNDKYIDFKFIIIKNIDEYATIFNAVNNSLPQKEDIQNKIGPIKKIVSLVNMINQHFDEYYFTNNNKKSLYKMIREDNVANPQPPCLHIDKLKKSTDFMKLIDKYDVEILFSKIIKLNEFYSTQKYDFFGYTKTKIPNYYNKSKLYGFYLALHKGEPMKWITCIK